LDKFYKDGDIDRPKKRILSKDETRNYITNDGMIRKLLRHCPECGSECKGEALAKSFGVDVEFYVDCKKCGLVTWSTQPSLSPCPLRKGNLDTTAAVSLCGQTFKTLELIAENLNLEIMSSHTFYE
jgi:hypothetical protein